MRNFKAKPSPNKQNQSQDQTNKKLQFLLPSSKQIILLNSSIKYNPSQPYNKEFSSKKYIKNPSNKNVQPPQIKQNTSTLHPPVIEQEYSINKIIDKGTSGQNPCQGFKIVSQSYHCLNIPLSISNNKAASAVFFPSEQQQQQKHLTSLNNIISSSRKQLLADSKQLNNTEQLITRINNLQKLVFDIINGKIDIPQMLSCKHKSLQTKNKQSLKLIEQKSIMKDKRSISCEPAKAKTKTKLKLDSTSQQKKEPIPKKIQQTKPFIIKKKNNLKIGSNYQPMLNYPTEEPIQLKNLSNYINPLTDSIQKSNAYSKMKLRVNFMPNIINL